MKVGIVGTKLMAKRRAQALKSFPEDQLVCVVGSKPKTSDAFARAQGVEAASHWKELVQRSDIDAVLLCLPTHLHAEVGIAALRSGKHVLCEKPLARTVEEASSLLAAAKDAGKVLKCGFNHRYHPSVRQAQTWIREGRIGGLTHARARYGICGRPGYEKEWRFDKSVVSGGHLMEHGIHVLDLFRMLLGEIEEVFSWRQASFWSVAPLEDNAFLILKTRTGVVVSFHSSLTQWKNQFSLEIFGKDGMIVLEGLGGSYGTEKVEWIPRGWEGPFTSEVKEFRGEDVSWKEEWRDFREAVLKGHRFDGTGEDGVAALQTVFAAYRAGEEGMTQKVPTS